MNKEKCIICGFDSKVENHHIIKVNMWGTNKEDNLVWLCPNHHWIADFGTDKEQEMLLQEIKRITSKEGSEDVSNKEYSEKLIRAILETNLNYKYYESFDEDDWKQIKESWNFLYLKKIILARPGSLEYNIKQKTIKKGELLFLIKLLSKELYKLEQLKD